MAREGRGGDRFTVARRRADAVAMTPWERNAMLVAQFTELQRADLYTPEFRATLPADRLAPHVIRDPWLASDATELLDRVLDVDVQTFLAGMLLVKMDIATMAHSLEVRSPLLDHRFMEMAARLPASVKLDGKTSKRILKDAVRPWLPDRILDRPKMGFGVPVGDWLRGPLRELPREVLLDPRSLERGIFRPDGVRALVDTHLSGARDHSHRIWVLLQLELWLRTFVDAPVPRAPALSV
jgi:asparagine synthase (glutamine-hydrolysing)